MHTFIDFPNLGIHLENVGKTVTVFGFDIAYYGITIAVGMLAGILVATQVAKRTGQKQEDYIDLAIFGIIFGIIGARIYYVIFAWDMYKDNLLEIFNTRHGGLAIYGGVIAAVITVFVVARVKKIPVGLMLDIGGCGLITGQMIGRWGNFFNREAFGEYTNGPLAMRLPLDAVRSSDVTQMMRDHVQTVDGVSCIQVSPTFLYESFWCLLVLILIFSFITKKSVFGRHLYAMGGNIKAARLSGINTDKLMFIVYTISGLMATIAGILVCARLNSASPKAGEGYETDAIAACFLGGASISGGAGTVFGVMVGALIMGVLNNGMSLLGVSIDWQSAIKGLVVLVAVAFDMFLKNRQRG